MFFKLHLAKVLPPARKRTSEKLHCLRNHLLLLCGSQNPNRIKLWLNLSYIVVFVWAPLLQTNPGVLRNSKLQIRHGNCFVAKFSKSTSGLYFGWKLRSEFVKAHPLRDSSVLTLFELCCDFWCQIRRKKQIFHLHQRHRNPMILSTRFSIFMRKIDAISRHLCKTLFAESFQVDESIKKYTLIENFCMISNRALVSNEHSSLNWILTVWVFPFSESPEPAR